MSDADRKLVTTRRAFLLAGAAVVAGVGAWDAAGVLDQRSQKAAAAAEASAQRAAATAAEARLLTFPRTGTYFLGQDRLPSETTLAQYDLVVISHEWPHRVPADYFTALRAANPRMKLLAYVDLVDSMSQLGTATYWPESYALWQFRSSTVSRFPRAWLARTAAGVPVHEYQDSVMTNLTAACPRVGGQRFVDYAADWVTGRVWATKAWDGIFLDVWADRLWTVDQNAWDITGTGTDVPKTKIFGPGNPLDQGLTSGERTMRSRLPGSILVANGTRTLHQGLLDGLVWESFADPLAGRDPATDFTSYVNTGAAGAHRSPGVSMTISSQRVTAGSAADYQRARFALTATLMQNGYWAPMSDGYGQPLYFDEMDGAGRGRGYLGHAVETNPSLSTLSRATTGRTGSPAPHVYRRDFEHGIALVNLGGDAQEVALGRTYRHLSGVTDRQVNDGTSADIVTIPGQDGVILVDR
ncbi:MAG TPA: putative glycoside hydrolase [Streptosporangiaceae bacterium]|nr:putative glycoside hydrolase [Streptosporangiaceae bacterium]